MIILGIDPGLLITGYGVIEASGRSGAEIKEAGVVRTKSQDCIAKRLAKIYNNVIDIIKEYSPEVLVLEKLYSHYKHPVTSILMGHARGVVCLASGTSKIKLVSYPSTRVKKAITGNGHASKQQVQSMIKNLLCLKSSPEPVDVSDALALALTYADLELEKIK